ncbi:hypothetical protein EYF80_047704 [Liparis tanakae]|uniref:Uncharacterized protein n=1 Tax=Liparis tanakae TaxID=230148 RepID=A0A4Z2FMH1_9TELE|nr:hypothetical protein EYF80_047704 [Liparis tanakae]
MALLSADPVFTLQTVTHPSIHHRGRAASLAAPDRSLVSVAPLDARSTRGEGACPGEALLRHYLQPQDSTTMSSYCLYTTLFPESMYRMLMGLSLDGAQQLGGMLLGFMEFIRVWMMAWLVGSRWERSGKSHTPSQWYAS